MFFQTQMSFLPIFQTLKKEIGLLWLFNAVICGQIGRQKVCVWQKSHFLLYRDGQKYLDKTWLSKILLLHCEANGLREAN